MFGCPPWCCGGQKVIPPSPALRFGLEESYPPFSGLKIRAGAPIKKIADIDAWRPEASMTGWPGWLACLAWLGWLGWIDWNDCLNPHTLDALEEVGGFGLPSCIWVPHHVFGWGFHLRLKVLIKQHLEENIQIHM